MEGSMKEQLVSGDVKLYLMAYKKPTDCWVHCDALLDIRESQRISREKIDSLSVKENKIAFIKTDNSSLVDIFCFLPLVYELKKRTGWKVVMSVQESFKSILLGSVTGYGPDIVGGEDKQPMMDYIGHLMGLFGHLRMTPAAMRAERVMLTASDRAFRLVTQLINPILSQGKYIAAVFLDEHCPETLSSEPFKLLARNNSDLVIMDCGRENSRVSLDLDQKSQYVRLSEQEQTFDAIIALGRIMSVRGNVVGFGSDHERVNICVCSLSRDAQERMAFIVPDIQKYDVREEGEGVRYKQIISNCWVYQCNAFADQHKLVRRVYKNMLENQ